MMNAMNAMSAQPLRLVDSGLPGKMGPQGIGGTVYTFFNKAANQGFSVLINLPQEETDALTNSVIELIQSGKSVDIRYPVSNRSIFIPGYLSKETMFVHEKF
jgi:hypothetical protein